MAQAVAPSVPAALIDAAARFDGLIRSVRDPKAIAIGHWTALQTIAHVAVTSTFDAFCCRSDVPVPDGLADVLAQAADGARIADVERLNALALERFTERDIERLADHIAHNAGIMAFVATAEPERTTTWLGGVDLTMRTVAAHFLGELLIHGLDIARSQHVDWEIGEEEAHRTFEDGYMEIIRGATLLASPRRSPVSAEFRPVGYDAVRISVVPGEIAVGPPDGTRADVVITGAPSTLIQMMFDRISPYASVATGRVKLGGRRPWRVLRFRRQLRMP